LSKALEGPITCNSIEAAAVHGVTPIVCLQARALGRFLRSPAGLTARSSAIRLADPDAIRLADPRAIRFADPMRIS